MATLTIRDFDDALKAQLRIRAAENGRSMEAEVRAILADALTEPVSGVGLGSRIRQRFSDMTVEPLEPPSRTELPRVVEFPE